MITATIRQIPLLAVLVLSAAFALSSCRNSTSGMPDMEEQRELWAVQMNEAFPERTSDTVELRRRLDVFRERGNKVGEHNILRSLGNSARGSSQFGRAIERHTAALEVAYEIFDTVAITTLLNELGTDFRRTRVYDEAMKYHYQSLAMSEDYGGRDTSTVTRNIASSWNGIGVVYSAMNEQQEAVRSYENALKIEIGKQNFLGMAMNYANIGSVWLDRGEWDRAMKYFELSLENNIKVNSALGIGLCNLHIGTIHEMRGDRDGALARYLKAYDILGGTSDTWHRIKACFSIGEAYMANGDYRRAKSYLDEGMLAAVEIDSPGYIEQAHTLLSDYHYALGDYRTSRDELQSSRAWADTVSHNLETNRLLESRVQYETAQYTRRIEEMDAEERAERIQRRYGTAIAAMVAAMVIAGVWFLSRRENRKRREESERERKRAEDLQELEKMRSNFFTHMTHEFRTPLTMILGPSGLLLKKYKNRADADPDDVEKFKEINRNGNTLLHLVNKLLEFARSESGNTRLTWRRGDMAALLRSVAEPYEKAAQSKSINLSFVSDTDELVMNYAREAIKTVFGNLLSNAIKHTPQGGRIEMFMRSDRQGERCVITVRDNGGGIAPENLPNIFELYYTTHTDGMGSGIGLALTKQLVEEMGGTIGVASTPGRGTEFTVSLPIALSAIPEDNCDGRNADGFFDGGMYAETDEIKRHANPLPGEIGDDGKNVVLVVEDNRDVANYIRSVLGDRYIMLHAVNGVEGLEIAEKYVPDIIITDVMMPEKDGYALTAEIRASVAVSHVPVIMLTAKATDDDRIEGFKTRADAYLTKPFNEEELQVRIEQLLESRAKLQKIYSQMMLSDAAGEATNGVDQGDLFLTKLQMAINLHLDDNSDISTILAEEMCLSKSQLYRKLKAISGGTVSSLVMQTRLNRAKLMLEKAVSIKEVAFACGFDNPSYFARCFKEQFGVSPSQFLSTSQK